MAPGSILFEFLPGEIVRAELFQQHGELVPNRPRKYVPGWPPGEMQSCFDSLHGPACKPQPYVTDTLWITLILAFFWNTRLLLREVISCAHQGLRMYVTSKGVGLIALDWSTICLLFSLFGLEFVAQYETPAYSLSPLYYPNWYGPASSLEQFRSALAVLILLLWVRIFAFASAASPRFSVIGKSLMRATSDVIVFFALFGILFCFYVCFYLKYSGYHEEFSTIFRSVQTMSQALHGELDVTERIFKEDPLTSFIFYTTFSFGLIFTMLSILIAIVNEHFIDLSNEHKRMRKNDTIPAFKRSLEGRKIVDWMHSVPQNLEGSLLRVVVWSAVDLASGDATLTGGTADPYVIVSLGAATQGQKSNTVRRTLSPVWKFGVEFEGVSSIDDPMHITFTVMDADLLTADDELGQTKIDVMKALRGNSSRIVRRDAKRGAIVWCTDVELPLKTLRVSHGVFGDRLSKTSASRQQKGILKVSLI